MAFQDHKTDREYDCNPFVRIPNTQPQVIDFIGAASNKKGRVLIGIFELNHLIYRESWR